MKKAALLLFLLCAQSGQVNAESALTAYTGFIFKLSGPSYVDGTYRLEVDDKEPLDYPSTIWIHGANRQISKLEFLKKGKQYETYTGNIENEKYVSIIYKATEGKSFFPFLASTSKHTDLPDKIFERTYIYSSGGLNNDIEMKNRIESFLLGDKAFPFKIDDTTKNSCSNSPRRTIVAYSKDDIKLYYYSAECTDWQDGHVEGKTYSTLLKADNGSFQHVWESQQNHETLTGGIMADIDNDSNPETIISYWNGMGVQQLVEIEDGKLKEIKTLVVSGD